MKGNRTLKKYLAMAMAIVFVVSGIVFTPSNTKADVTWTDISSQVSSTWSTAGGYEVYGYGCDGYACYTADDDVDHVRLGRTGGGWWERWLVQLRKTVTGLEAQQTYTVNWTMSSTRQDGTLHVSSDGDTTYDACQPNTTPQTVVHTTSTDANGVLTVTSYAGTIGNNNIVEYSDFTVYDSGGNQVYPAVAPGDGYQDCVNTGAQYQSNGWGYDRLSSSVNLGYRIGTYDGLDYVMELKNREETAKNAEVISPQFGDAETPCTEAGKKYRYTLKVRNNASSAINAQIAGYYYHNVVLPLTEAETVNATSTKEITGTFTAPDTPATDYGRFQIKLNNIPAGGEVGVLGLTIEEVSPWERIDTYGSFADRGFWEYYVDSSGEGFYHTDSDPNTAEEVGFKYVKKDSVANSTRYRMRTSVLSDGDGNFNVGDYYDYSFTIGIDEDSIDALANGHIKVVEYTGDSATSFVTLQDIPAVNKNSTLAINGTCGATVNGSRIGIVVSQEDDISLHITNFTVSRRGNATEILKSTKVAIEGFQIQSNNTGASVSYRTLCRAPRIGTGITVDGETYTVAALGTSYALDPNDSGDNDDNVLNDSYTILDTDNPVTGQQYKYEGVKKYNNQNRTYGYEANETAIIDGWKEGDTANAYYAFTMQGMDEFACNTLWVRPFVKATKTVEGETVTVFIYGTITAYTSVAEIADYLYGNSLAKNITSHQYLYSILNNSSIVPTSNPHHRYATGTEIEHGPVTYGWSNTLYIGFRLVPDTYDPNTGNIDNMQYVNIEDWKVHANSSYGPSEGVTGASASYKGVTNDEMMVRIEQPGYGDGDEWGNFINWGVQIRLPNRKAYDRLVDGKYYQLTLRYKTTKAGNMRVKYEGNTDLMTQYENAEYDGHKEAYIHKVTNQKVGYNEITETFQYHDGYSHGQNDASIVIVPCGSLGSDDGFPAGTILSEFSITFDEIPAP